jgi:hypothetical protein
MVYSTNLVPNPSVEVGLTGYAALSGATISQTSQDALSGQYSMSVTTPGLVSGEGFTAPSVTFTGVVVPSSMQLGLSGESGILLVSAVVTGTGVIAQVTVNLTPAWQTVTLNGLAISSGATAYLVVQTSSPQPLTFLADAFQYEPESPAHPYIDGSLPGCSWTGTPNASSSTRAYQYTQSFSGGSAASGSIMLAPIGTAYPIQLPAGGSVATGSIGGEGASKIVEVSPFASFGDFAIFPIGSPDPNSLDPARTYAGWNNAGIAANGASPGYVRPWGIFYPPLDYYASQGQLLWPRAQFMAMGIQLGSVPSAAKVYLTGAQVELMPLAGVTGLDLTPAPSPYDFPRAVHTIIKPTRLNYAPNPNFAVSNAGWNTYGSATLSPTGSAVFTSTSDAIALTITGLITGDDYTASLNVALPAGAADLRLSVGSQSGGIPGADGVTDLEGGNFTPELTFTAPASTVLLYVFPVLATVFESGTYYDEGAYGEGFYGVAEAFPIGLDLSQILIEAGQVVGTYFDGDGPLPRTAISGVPFYPEYAWEEGGTAGLSRSYYYDQRGPNHVVIDDILTRQVPVSISAADALYLTPPSQ